MAATSDQIAQLRRMCAEVGGETYSDDQLKAVIEGFPTVDERGEVAVGGWDGSTEPPTPILNACWIPTYDMAAAAAMIWEEKAAVLQSGYDFNADGGSYQRSQMFLQAMSQARYWRSRRKVGTVTQKPWPRLKTYPPTPLPYGHDVLQEGGDWITDVD